MTPARRCQPRYWLGSAVTLLVAALGLTGPHQGWPGFQSAWAAAPGDYTPQQLVGPQLLVLDKQGHTLLTISLASDSNWVVRWNHSVTGIEVSDYYQLRGGVMYLIATHTPSFDAGLGHIPGRGSLESDAQHGYWIRGIDEAVVGNAYRLRVGPKRVDHRIVHAGHTYSLSDLAADQPVTIEVAP